MRCSVVAFEVAQIMQISEFIMYCLCPALVGVTLRKFFEKIWLIKWHRYDIRINAFLLCNQISHTFKKISDCLIDCMCPAFFKVLKGRAHYKINRNYIFQLLVE